MNNQVGVGTTLTDRPTARPIALAIPFAPSSSGPVGGQLFPACRAGSIKAATATRAISSLDGRRVTAIAKYPRKHSEVRSKPRQQQVGVSEEAWPHDRMRDSGRH